MRFRTLLPAFALVAVGAFMLPGVTHAALPFFGPIIPSPATSGVAGSNVCPASWGMVMVVVNNIIQLLITIAIVFVAPLMIAWAGFLLVVNALNPSGKARAKGILMNTIIGIVIALAAWLIVDAVLAALTGKSMSYWTTNIGTGGAAECLTVKSALSTAPSSPTVSAVTQAPLATNGTGPCDANIVSTSAQQAGYSLTTVQANELACIANYESTCGTKNQPYNLNYSWNKANAKGYASTAAGAYQVLLSSNSSCYDNSLCEQAAGTPGVPLNCNTAFDSKGFTKSDSASQATLLKCQKAAGTVTCSAAAAACLLQHQSFQSAYGADSHTASCISQSNA